MEREWKEKAKKEKVGQINCVLPRHSNEKKAMWQLNGSHKKLKFFELVQLFPRNEKCYVKPQN